jgi:hypothetical protein
MKVSIITPTCQQGDGLKEILACVLSQQGVDWEWLVWDSSPRPDPVLANWADPRIQYTHCPDPLILGDKRNRLIAMATGDWIAHFEANTHYPPHYLAHMIASACGAGLVVLGQWSVVSDLHGVMATVDVNASGKPHIALNPDGTMTWLASMDLTPGQVWGQGFRYVYRRDLQAPFPVSSDSEDEDWVLTCMGNVLIATVADLDVLHRMNPTQTAYVQASSLVLDVHKHLLTEQMTPIESR